MPTHTHTHTHKTHAKPHKSSEKQKKQFVKPKHPFEKKKKKHSDMPLLTVALLQEIRKLVEANNRSKQSTEMVICQIYKESSFNKNTGNGGKGAKGLMQLLKNAVKQAYAERLKDQLGHTPNDKQKVEAFNEGLAMYNSSKIFDEAINIQLGTEYLQYCIDLKKSVSAGYQKYRGPEEFDYYSKIQACAVKLKNNPNSIQPLIDMNK